jgi:hypothetical protein
LKTQRKDLPSEVDEADEASKQRALARLRERYGEARDLVSGTQPYANLDWILGSKRNRSHGPSDLGNRTIEVVTLWLQDLALEVDRQLPPRPTDRLDQSLQSAYRTRHSLATRLRVATEGFVMAFRRKVIKGDASPKSGINAGKEAQTLPVP